MQPWSVLSLSAVAIATFASNAASAPSTGETFWIGPYYLGMPATEARAIGIEACKPVTRAVKCTATYGPIDGKDLFTVTIGDKSGRVEEIDFHVGSPCSDRYRYGSNVCLEEERKNKPSIALPQCKPGWGEASYCYLPPNKVLWRDGHGYKNYRLTASTNKQKVDDFIRRKTADEAGKRRAQRVQYGP